MHGTGAASPPTLTRSLPLTSPMESSWVSGHRGVPLAGNFRMAQIFAYFERLSRCVKIKSRKNFFWWTRVIDGSLSLPEASHWSSKPHSSLSLLSCYDQVCQHGINTPTKPRGAYAKITYHTCNEWIGKIAQFPLAQ